MGRGCSWAIMPRIAISDPSDHQPLKGRPAHDLKPSRRRRTPKCRPAPRAQLPIALDLPRLHSNVTAVDQAHNLIGGQFGVPSVALAIEPADLFRGDNQPSGVI
jgi:hypothetical protein